MSRPWLVVAGDFTPFGGMDRANYELARHLASQPDVELHLVTHRAGGALATAPGVALHLARRPLGSHAAGMAFLAREGRRWAQRLAPRGARVVTNGGNCAWPDVNWVHYVHAAWVPEAGGGILRRTKAAVLQRWNLASEREALRQARLVVVNSRRTRRDLVERVGVAEDKVHVVYYGTDPDQFRPATPAERSSARERLGLSPSRTAIGFIGGLGDRRKGFDALFDAFGQCAAGPGIDAALVVVGAGRDLPRWQARARAAGLGERILFLGYRTDVPLVLAGLDALVAPTRYEAYGLGVHEALCCGLPAFVSRDAGVAERYPPELGDLLLPDPGDVADLARRLAAFCGHPGRHAAPLESLSRTLRAETWSGMAARIQALVGP